MRPRPSASPNKPSWTRPMPSARHKRPKPAQRNVLIEGFADSTGAADYNQGLSERRASAVRTALLDLGVARERIDMRGYGESFPVAANDSAASRQLNRRVEIVLSDNSGKIVAR